MDFNFLHISNRASLTVVIQNVSSQNKEMIILPLDESTTQLKTSHHDTSLPDKSCDVDVDFQSSISHMSILWNLPANVTTLVSNVKWGIQENTRSVHSDYSLALYEIFTIGMKRLSHFSFIYPFVFKI